MTTVPQQTRLAFERRGSGVPIVLLPGLTFGRAAWRPIVDRLGERVCTIAVDLPAQGESAGPPCELSGSTAQAYASASRSTSAGRLWRGASSTILSRSA